MKKHLFLLLEFSTEMVQQQEAIFKNKNKNFDKFEPDRMSYD